MDVSTHLPKKSYTISINDGTVQEKVFKFPDNYSSNIQMYNKIHEKVYKKVKIFHNMIYKT